MNAPKIATTATVAHVSDDAHQVTINRGANHGVELGQHYLIYTLSESEILDPETNETLGRLEIVKGTGVVIHTQERMATLQSTRSQATSPKRIVRKPTVAARAILGLTSLGLTEEEELQNLPPRQLPFESPRIGDRAKRVT